MTTLEYLRHFRLGGYAIFDFTVAFLGIFLLSPLLSKLFLKLRLDIPKRNWLFLTLPIGIFVHLIIGNITPLTASFFNPNGEYLIKLIILLMLILGLKGIKIVNKK